MQKYKSLRELFLSVASNHINEDLLTIIKDHYKSVINSQRVFDTITTMEKLIWILEKRGVLGPDNINPMLHIAQFYIIDRNLDKIISKFEKENQQKDCVEITIYNHGKFKQKFQSKSVENLNHTVTKKVRHKNVKQTLWQSFMCVILVIGLVILITLITSHYHLNSSLILKKTISNLSDTEIHRDQEEYEVNLWEQNVQTSNRSCSVDHIQSLVTLHLSERLGTQWRDFARYTNVIREVEIDQIQISQPNAFKNNTIQMLKIYFSKANPNSWDKTLLDALQSIRRKDLADHIQKLL